MGSIFERSRVYVNTQVNRTTEIEQFNHVV